MGGASSILEHGTELEIWRDILRLFQDGYINKVSLIEATHYYFRLLWKVRCFGTRFSKLCAIDVSFFVSAIVPIYLFQGSPTVICEYYTYCGETNALWFIGKGPFPPKKGEK